MIEDRGSRMEDQMPNAGTTEAGAPVRASVGRKLAIGCFMTWLGFFSGAMVAALLSKLATFVTRAPECSELPSCNWYVWAGVGGVIGAVTLPVLVIRAMGRPSKLGSDKSEY
jgi:hypothetical protein